MAQLALLLTAGTPSDQQKTELGQGLAMRSCSEDTSRALLWLSCFPSWSSTTRSHLICEQIASAGIAIFILSRCKVERLPSDRGVDVINQR
jgi:lauroyl/myristoyl acyltransferase